MTSRVRLLSVASALPPLSRSSAEVESRIAESSPGYRPRPGAVAAISGVNTRRVAADNIQCSDLAAEAALLALDKAGVHARDVDVLIFAAASQDLLEPATANIVQEKVGTSCQVFDVKNACNSFLNGLQLAEALIQSGACRIALVTTGEVPSRAISWRVQDSGQFRSLFPGFTMGDAGAAAVVSTSDDARGIFYRRFTSVSRHWDLATINAGGSMHPRGEAHTYLTADGARLRQAFVDLGPAVVSRMLCEAQVKVTDFARIFIHQATVSYLDELLDATGIPAELVEHTIADLGNMAAASLPVAYSRAEARGVFGAGDRVMLLGLASGISVGVMMIDV